MLLYVNNITLEGFGIAPALVDTTLEIRLTGTGDGAAVQALQECLVGVKSELSRGSLTAVAFDIRTLYLLNSSCLKTFAAFVHELKSKGSACSIRFLVNAKLAWQSRALTAIARLAPAIVTIEPI